MRKSRKVMYVWFSKKGGYEKPCVVKGNSKHTGSQRISKGINEKIELSERGKPHGGEFGNEE